MNSKQKKKLRHSLKMNKDLNDNRGLSEEQVLQEMDPQQILEGLSENKREELIAKISVQQQSIFSGPLPPWEDLEQYNNIIPNGADRIMKMAEQQSLHRQAIEKAVVDSNNSDSRKGVIFAGIIGIIGIGGSVLLALYDNNTASFVIGGGTLVSLVGAFLRGTSLDKKDIKEKNEND